MKENNAPESVRVKKHFLYPSRWDRMLALFVGWRREKASSGVTEGQWLNARNQVKVLAFLTTYAQLMWALEKVEEKLKVESAITTHSCMLYPVGKDSLLKTPLVFDGAPRKECIYACVVEAVTIYNARQNSVN